MFNGKQSSKNQIYNSTKSNKKYLLIFAIFSLLLCMGSFQYYKNLQNTVRNESKDYLLEVSRRISNNVNQIITDNFLGLKTIATSINQSGSNYQSISKELNKQKEIWGYDMAILIDAEGNTYDLDNKEIFINIDNTLRTKILSKEDSMSTTQIIDNKEYVLFSVPLDDIEINGHKMIALCATYNASSFNDVLSMQSFSKQAVSMIVTKMGTIVTRASSESTFETGYNVFSSIVNHSNKSTSGMEKMKEELSEGKENLISFNKDDVNYYMVYTSIGREDWHLLTVIPTQVVNQKSEMLLNSTLVISGLIIALFSTLLVILIYSYTSHRKNLENIAFVDSITGGNTIAKFYELVHNALNSKTDIQYALIYTNIEKFKVLNEQIGRDACDSILVAFNNYITMELKPHEFIGRESADNFCILTEYKGKEELVERIKAWQNNATDYIKRERHSWGLPTTQFGIFVIEDQINFNVVQLIDRAKIALKEATNSMNSKFKYAFYDDNVRQKLFREKQIEDNMEEALKNGEFEVYLQPKYALPDESIGGAEALIRWIDPHEGMIYPNEFIQLFERNKFIIKVDLYVCEVVCKTLRKWIDCGLKPMRISINCSRVHFQIPNFLESYTEIIDKYGIDRSLIEIEFTESIVFDNSEALLNIIEQIKLAGLSCSVDDFGSGYSSLNMIQDIPVDTLKIDRIFFHSVRSDDIRTESVIRSIILMAKELSMITVAEGVESRAHVEMLKKIGCDFIQGYVFAKPMTIKEFEKIAFGQLVESKYDKG